MTLGICNEIKPYRIEWFKEWRVISQIRKKSSPRADSITNTKIETGMGKAYRRKGMQANLVGENGSGGQLGSLDL